VSIHVLNFFAITALASAGPQPIRAAGTTLAPTIDHYRIIRLLGEGGMGTVWLAERSDGRFERKAAVKFIRSALTGYGGEERFKREGAILGRLSHPNIAELLDAGVTESRVLCSGSGQS
jgi:serine/threonine protein kinase